MTIQYHVHVVIALYFVRRLRKDIHILCRKEITLNEATWEKKLRSLFRNRT